MATIGSRGFHHLHKRKRIHQKHEKYPNPNKFKRVLDILAYVAAIIGPLIAIPQLWKIWNFQDASGVSILTWIGYMFGGTFWFIYGAAHKEKPIMIMNLLWFLFSLTIVIGILRFG